MAIVEAVFPGADRVVRKARIKTQIRWILLNFKNKIDEIKTILQNWSLRRLTLLGRITVLKSLPLSKLVYHFSTLPFPPKMIIKELEAIFFDFLWNGKRIKLSETR